jgi:hypothetical protein
MSCCSTPGQALYVAPVQTDTSSHESAAIHLAEPTIRHPEEQLRRHLPLRRIFRVQSMVSSKPSSISVPTSPNGEAATFDSPSALTPTNQQHTRSASATDDLMLYALARLLGTHAARHLSDVPSSNANDN